MAQAEARGSPNGEADLGEPPAKKQKGSQDGTTSGRRQAACQACRLRKVKCDKKRPCCALCRASGVVCEYLGDSNEKITLETATHTILERLDNLRQELDIVKQGQMQQNTVYRPATQDPYRPSQTEDPSSLGNPQTSPFETSRDFLRIPPQRASADVILQWEVFGGKYPPNALIGQLFSPGSGDVPPSSRTAASPVPDLVTPSAGLLPLEEEQIPSLIDRFLTNVYTKNPILDVESLVSHGRKCADHGLGWDGWSCLVLMACALGSVAKPFSDRTRDSTALSPTTERTAKSAASSSARLYAKELQQGDSCFTLACRRLGSLKYSMLGAQCYFFAGVYLMYTLRPLQSWHYFFQASIFTQFYLRATHGLSDSSFSHTPLVSEPTNTFDRKARRIEQSLYWSCFKSECEYRVELPLPQSDISLGEYPQLFPSPPSPAPADDDDDGSAGMTTEELELRQHASRLCNEEESWYYYLTEIALRRIGNRIINSFFPSDAQSATSQRSLWINIRPLLRMAREFEAQVSSWSAHLPPAMQQYETSSIIRAPHLNFLGEGARSYVSRELSWAVDNRLLEMQTWLYQPFLYYLIHFGLPGRGTHVQATSVGPDGFATSPTLEGRQAINNLLNPWSPATASSAHSADFTSHPQIQPPVVPSMATATGSLDADDMTILESLITSGIDCSLKTLDVRPRGHRHHGLWFDLRSAMSAALTVLAIIKSGNAAWIPGGVEAVWGPEEYGGGSLGAGGRRKIGGRIGRVLGEFDFWSAEAPDMVRYAHILEEIVRDVRGA